MADVDAIVIGSGVGGLTAATALARSGKKVLVLEQHDVPGGWCHSFRLGGHQFSPGVHYVGELGPGGRMRGLFEGLGVADDMLFLELNPDGFEHCIIGDEHFRIPKGKERFAERLKQRFPAEARGIDGYLDLVSKVTGELQTAFLDKRKRAMATLPFRAPHLLLHGFRSLDSVLNSYVTDPVLKAILTLQAGDHGVGPKDVPAAVHMSIQAHYFDGGWYPRGGGQAIPKAFYKQIRAHGGELRVSTAVSEILTEKNGAGWRAIGVRLADGTEIRANTVISNADPHVTFERMLGRDKLSPRTAKALDKAKYSISALSLFLAADADLPAMGADSSNYWYTRTPNVQAGYDVCEQATLDLDEFPGQFLTVTTLKDRTKGLGRTHTMESFVFVGWDAFKRWTHTKFGERPQDYADMKEAMTEKMLRGVDRIVPGLSKRVTFKELGTPLTNEHYCMSTRGNLYGTAKTRSQVGPFGWPIRTEIDGLVMCGASTVSHGVLGASMSGLFAAASVLRCKSTELLTGKGQLRTLLADDTSAWPADLRARAEGRGAVEDDAAAK